MIKRQNPLNISDEELNQVMQYIIKRFGEEWFNKNQDHTLAKLYSRTDFLATNELYTLGRSLEIMDAIDKDWVNGRIKEIKSKNKNNLQGYCFELIGLAMLAGKQNYKLLPCKGNNPGTDGKLLFNDGLCMELSLKNYSISKHHEVFLKQSNELYNCCLKILNNKKTDEFLKILFVFNDYIGDLRTWDFLKQNLYNFIFGDNYQMPKEFSTKLAVLVSRTKLENNMNFNFSNHNFMIISPYHKNEKKNLYDKLNDAIFNLKKHMGKNKVYGLLIRLDINISIDNCAKWIEEYFEQNKDVLIEFIILYQPGTSCSLETNSTLITIFTKLILNNNKKMWILNHHQDMPCFTIQVGSIVDMTPKMAMINSITGQQTELKEQYVFQQGDMFYNALPNNENCLEGNISSPAPGIRIHSVFEINGKQIILSKIDADNEELKII